MGWDTAFACHMAEQGKEAHQAIHDHLAGIFEAGESLEDLVDEEALESPPSGCWQS